MIYVMGNFGVAAWCTEGRKTGLDAAGDAHIYNNPRAIIYHQAIAHRLNYKYLLTIHFKAQLHKAYRVKPACQTRVPGVSIPRLPQFGGALVKFPDQPFSSGPNRVMQQLMTVGHFPGTIAGYSKAARQKTWP